MTRLQRLARWLTPYRELWNEERKRSAALRVRVADLDAAVKAQRIDLAVADARWRLAQTQRDRARDLIVVLLGERSSFSGSDLAWLDEHGVDANG